ncbi:MAG: glycosyltransferase [Chitinophagaceae bacterium]|jgi:glycosyltransferase involved in cell wall biosynthesis
MSTNANILYISYDGMTDPLGQSQVLPYLAGLSAMGYKITLLSCEKTERWHHKETVQAICSKHHINWQPIMYTRKPPIISTIRDVRKMKKIAQSLHQKISFDLVHCRSYVSGLIGQWMQRKFGLPFIFDMRGFWANERVDGGLWNLGNPLYKRVFNYFKNKEKHFLNQSAAVVSLTYAAKDEIESWGIPHSPITVIPCCVDTKLFNPETLKPEQVAALRRKADLPSNKMVVGYVGSLGTWYLLNEMLAFFKFWLKDHPDSILFFVTNEPKQMIQDAAKKHRISFDNIRLIAGNRNEMPYYISLMDFGLFFIKNAYSKKASSPVKQGELMAMGVPVICNSGVGDSDFIINKYRSGELVHSFDETGFSASIANLKSDLNHPVEIRNGAKDYFDLQKGIDSYAALYESVITPAVNKVK